MASQGQRRTGRFSRPGSSQDTPEASGNETVTQTPDANGNPPQGTTVPPAPAEAEVEECGKRVMQKNRNGELQDRGPCVKPKGHDTGDKPTACNYRRPKQAIEEILDDDDVPESFDFAKVATRILPKSALDDRSEKQQRVDRHVRELHEVWSRHGKPKQSLGKGEWRGEYAYPTVAKANAARDMLKRAMEVNPGIKVFMTHPQPNADGKFHVLWRVEDMPVPAPVTPGAETESATESSTEHETVNA